MTKTPKELATMLRQHANEKVLYSEPPEYFLQAADLLETMEPGKETLENGPIVMDLKRRELRIDGILCSCIRKRWVMLEFFMRHQGRVLERKDILKTVWGNAYGEHYVSIMICELRKLPMVRNVLKVVPGVGYRMDRCEE